MNALAPDQFSLSATSSSYLRSLMMSEAVLSLPASSLQLPRQVPLLPPLLTVLNSSTLLWCSVCCANEISSPRACSHDVYYKSSVSREHGFCQLEFHVLLLEQVLENTLGASEKSQARTSHLLLYNVAAFGTRRTSRRSLRQEESEEVGKDEEV